MYEDAAVIGVVVEELEKLVPVFVRETDLLSIIATLRDMQRVLGGERIWVCGPSLD